MTSTSGSLDQGALPGVLRDVYVERRSGTLCLSRSDEEHRLQFHQGQLIDVGGPVADKLLAETVLERELVEPDAAAETGVATANCTLDDDNGFLYITSDMYLLRIPLIKKEK